MNKKTVKKLQLLRETLRDLKSADIRNAAGGVVSCGVAASCLSPSCPTVDDPC